MTTAAATFTDHGTFTIERDYPVAPARVFRAWADAAAGRIGERVKDEVERGLVKQLVKCCTSRKRLQ